MDHPITPPPELFAGWFANSLKKLDRTVSRDDTGTTGLIAGEIAIQAARWGADQELEACVKWLLDENFTGISFDLRADRRPKSPSLKELALASVKRFEESGEFFSDQMRELEFIRKALEQLDD